MSDVDFEHGHQGGSHDAVTGLVHFRFRDLDAMLGRWTSQDPLGYIDGANRSAALISSPVNGVDPAGLETYRQNRLLGLMFGNIGWLRGMYAARGKLTHTFIYTTNLDGSLKHTYSWGNDYDENGNGDWFKDRDEDVQAANEAIKDRAEDEAGRWPGREDVYGPKVGDDSLDDCIEEAFQDRDNDPDHPSRHPNRWVYSNCKTEADSLVDDARAKLEDKKNDAP